MKERARLRRASSSLTMLAIAFAVGTASRALAADDIEDALSGAGKVWYDKYCTPCHGPGGVKVVLRRPGMVLTAGMPSACGKIV